jgi:hypothetical protein
VAAILVLGLFGLGLRAVPTVLADDLRTLVAGPRPVTGGPAATSSARASSPTPSRTSSSPTPITSPSVSPTKDREPSTKTQRKEKAVVVPATGPGTYAMADTSVKPASTAGRLIRFDVRVEDNLEIDPDEAAEQIAEVLNDKRSWRGTGRWRFQLVSVGAGAEMHAYIVTPGTTDRLCAPLRTRGDVSCQNGSRVVLNAKRWLLGADSYGADLKNYRRYLVNHEFGHYLGYRHVECPGAGESAPVMMQQTKGLDGCRKNPWVESD